MQNGGSNMAPYNIKNCLFYIKIKYGGESFFQNVLEVSDFEYDFKI